MRTASATTFLLTLSSRAANAMVRRFVPRASRNQDERWHEDAYWRDHIGAVTRDDLANTSGLGAVSLMEIEEAMRARGWQYLDGPPPVRYPQVSWLPMGDGFAAVSENAVVAHYTPWPNDADTVTIHYHQRGKTPSFDAPADKARFYVEEYLRRRFDDQLVKKED